MVENLKKLDNDPLAHLQEPVFARHAQAGGCFTIIGPIQICWKVEGSRIKVCLVLAGVEVVCQYIDTSNPCVSLEGNVICAKASIKVCLEDRCLTFEATACYRDFPCLGLPWQCVSDKGNIVCF
ncbi:hypothetical protein EHM82_04485 [bacterium]|nr:MAG: hypothetical protein EHM82_04485 [bacterium]